MGYPWFSIPCQGWPEWLGIGGRIKSESVAGLCRNGWPEWLGILKKRGTLLIIIIRYSLNMLLLMKITVHFFLNATLVGWTTTH